jgi:MFS family permease
VVLDAGINTIIYYAPTILSQTSLGQSGAVLANVGIGVVNVAMTVVAIRLIDRAGRKPLLLAGLVGMVAALVIGGLTFLLLGSEGAAAWIVTASLTLFIASFAVSWGPTVWVMLPEIFPLKVRGSAMGVAIILHWGANFIVSLSYPVLIAAVGEGPVFLGYAIVGVAAFLFVRSFVTETKGRSLEEIEADLRQKAVV